MTDRIPQHMLMPDVEWHPAAGAVLRPELRRRGRPQEQLATAASQDDAGDADVLLFLTFMFAVTLLCGIGLGAVLFP